MSVCLSPLLFASRQEPEGQRANRNVLIVHEVLFVKRQPFHQCLGFRNIFRVEEKQDAPPIAAREPLADSAVQIQFDGRPNLSRHHLDDLLRRDALLRGEDDQHGCRFGSRRRGGLSLQDRAGQRQQTNNRE